MSDTDDVAEQERAAIVAESPSPSPSPSPEDAERRAALDEASRKMGVAEHHLRERDRLYKLADEHHEAAGQLHEHAGALLDGKTLAAIEQRAQEHLRPISGRELVELVVPAQQEVCGFLSDEETAMIYAKRGVGKTLFALSYAVAVAGGGRFLNWKAPVPRKVCFVDGELPLTKIQERVQLAVAMLTDNSADPLDNMKIITPGIDRRSPNLADEDGRRMIEEHLDGIGLLLLDSHSTLCRGGVENEAESWQPIQDWLVNLRARRIPSLLFHHAGKSGAQRGTSKREDVFDIIVRLQHPADYTPSDGARFEIAFEKARSLIGEGVEGFEARIEGTPPGWTFKTLPGALRDRILHLHGEGLSGKEIAAEVGRHPSSVSRILADAKRGAE